MRYTKIIWALLLVSTFSSVSNSQTSETILVDEFDKNVSCEDLSSRLDVFIAALTKNPDAIGYVVIGIDSQDPDHSLKRERYVDGYARYRAFDEARLNVARGTTRDSHVMFWLVPPGAKFEVPDPSYELASDRRKTRLYSDLWDAGACYTGPPLRLLSNYLKSNPGTVANIAIATPSAKAFTEERANIAKLFDEKYNVRSTRIRFFRHPVRTYSNGYELWILKKKAARTTKSATASRPRTQDARLQ